MKVLINFVSVLILIFNSSFTSLNDKEKLILGSWESNEGTFKSIDFMKYDMARVVSISNGKPTAMDFHYKITSFDEENDYLTIQFLNKDLFKEEYRFVSSIIVVLKDKNRITLLSNSGKAVQMSRKENR
ncbi:MULTISPECIES: hypothetical protein [Sphingobacterium]|uniref:hypothetical protein n=1 Tax=Sphingobacterium TaxID=28453 RepID=UPI0013DD1838|nr:MULTISPECIES: hypothetical protein [unclassified Sphingobacterium]